MYSCIMYSRVVTDSQSGGDTSSVNMPSPVNQGVIIPGEKFVSKRGL